MSATSVIWGNRVAGAVVYGLMGEFIMKVYLIRHGETEYNKQRKLQGKCDIELNEYGRELAKITAEALKNVNFDVVYTSPLKRAKETAQIIIGEKKIAVIEEARIQEISFGDYEGLCCQGENFNIPDKSFRNFFDLPEEYNVPPNGETFEEVIKRTGEFWNELIQKKEYADKTILVSTHGCALKAILANINSVPIAEFWGTGVHKNCAVTIVDVSDKCIKVEEEGKLFYGK